MNEMLDHLLGNINVGDDSVTKRADCLDLIGGLAHHELGVVANRLDPLDPIDGFDRHHRRLVEHDPAAADIDQRIGRAQVDRHVV